MTNIGIITYQTNHLKTEQILLQLIGKYAITVYALPFLPRPARHVLFQHRPDQSMAAHPQDICNYFHIKYIPVSSDKEIPNSCDYYLITGAGILSAECLQGKQVINAHPGIIPATRGLDAFKWSIYKLLPVGVTLHFVDENIDAGTIISVQSTSAFSSDSLTSFARRHYENEITMLAKFENFLKKPSNPFINIQQSPSRRRMKAEQETELTEKFNLYKQQYC